MYTSVSDVYQAYINCYHKLKLQLQLIPDAVKLVPLDGFQIRQVTRIQTICDIFNQQSSLKKFLTEVHKLLKVHLTVPVTTAPAECNFSALNLQIKLLKGMQRHSST